MILAISPYKLYLRKGGFRSGFLLKLTGSAGIGYADCHPWEEFGDDSVDAQINCLRKGKETPLLVQALSLAQVDAEARKAKRSLFENVMLPESHLLTDLTEIPSKLSNYFEWGMKYLKIKLRSVATKELIEKSALIAPYGIKWRFDFNSSLSSEQAEEFLESTKEIHSQIDLIEDICPYSPCWKRLQDKYNIPLAADFERADDLQLHPCVYKPASRPLDRLAKRLIVTSSLGHPVGQLLAAYVATTLPQAKHEVGGWLSHLVYQPTKYSEQFKIEKGQLIPPDGTGCGFNDLLEKEPWITL